MIDRAKILSSAKTLILSSVIPAIAGMASGAYVSNSIGDRFSRQIEDSKNRSSSISQQKSSFDNALNNIYVELGAYTGSLFDGKKHPEKDKVDAAIVQTQLQLNELQHILAGADNSSLIHYADTLDNLKKSLDEVKSPSDLDPVYDAARKMLYWHDRIDEEVSKQVKISSHSPTLPISFPLA